jgi:hypothetical protein
MRSIDVMGRRKNENLGDTYRAHLAASLLCLIWQTSA